MRNTPLVFILNLVKKDGMCLLIDWYQLFVTSSGLTGLFAATANNITAGVRRWH